MTNETRQYGKMFFDLLGTMPTSQVVVYTVIYDRMNSSVIRNNFFDKKENRHYVIYTRKEMAELIGVSERTAGDLIKALVKKGYLKVKRQFTGANKIFIPDFNEDQAVNDLEERKTFNSESEEISSPYEKKLPVNQSTYNQTNNKQVNTINTDKPEKTKEVVQEQNESFDVNSWIESTVNGFSMNRGIPENIAKYSQYYDNPKDFCYNAIGVVSKVRASIAKKFGVNNSEKSQFDSNANFGNKLASKVKSVFVHAITKKITKAEDVMKYLNKSLQKFFTEATGNAMAVAEPAYAPSMKSEAPVEDKKPSKKPSHVVTPEWLNNKQEEVIPAPSEEAKAKVREMLKNFE